MATTYTIHIQGPDDDMLKGASIPKDVVQSAEGGTGYNGRLVPPAATGEYEWSLAPSTGAADVSGFMEYPKELPPDDEPDAPVIVEGK
jgi:hypothetical protein